MFEKSRESKAINRKCVYIAVIPAKAGIQPVDSVFPKV